MRGKLQWLVERCRGARSRSLALETRVLIGVTILGLMLRVPGLAWGLPNAEHLASYHPDEGTVYGHAARMALTGDLNPRFFNYGSLPLMLGALLLKLTGTASWSAPAAGHLVLRLASVVAGVVTIALAAAIARRVYRSASAALAAGAFVAVAPVAAMNSQFATVDVLAACLLACSVLASTRILDEDRRVWYVLAGLFAGLSAACKYVGILALLPAYAAHVLRERTWRSLYAENALLSVLVGLGGFAAGCPYAFLDSGAFWRDFTFEVEHVRRGGTTELLGQPPLVHMAGSVLPCALTWPLWAATLAGAAVVIARRRSREVLLLAWCAALLLAHGTGREIFVRYAVALVPFFAGLFGAMALPLVDNDGGSQRSLRVVRWGPLAGAVVALVWAGATAWATSSLMAREDTRDQAAALLRPALAKGGGLGLATHPWFYTPPVLFQNDGPRRKLSDFYAEADSKGIDLALTGWDTGVLNLKKPEWYAITEFEFYWQLRAGRPAAVAFLDRLERDYVLVAAYEGKLRLGPMVLPRPRLHDWRYVSPEVRVYRRREAATR